MTEAERIASAMNKLRQEAEKRKAAKTFHSETVIDDRGGRFAALGGVQIIGKDGPPSYPPGDPWTDNVVPPEPPLGECVDWLPPDAYSDGAGGKSFGNSATEAEGPLSPPVSSGSPADGPSATASSPAALGLRRKKLG